MKPTLTKPTFEQFQSFLVEEAGLYFAEDRIESLEEKLQERMEICSLKDFDEYLRYLKFSQLSLLERKALLDILTIGETYFFRNEPQFEALKNYVLPKIIANNSRSLRIWSAGCSTGEEPYSLAILLRETLPDFESWNISILATDLNRNSLSVARKGVYGKRAVQEIPLDLLEKYFHCRGQKYWLSEDIKNRVVFENHNLARDSFSLEGMQDLDVLLCRNVTIYFDPPTTKRVIHQFAECLKPESHFFIGHTETLWDISEAFQPIEFPQTFIYQKLREPLRRLVAQPGIPLPTEVYRRRHRHVKVPVIPAKAGIHKLDSGFRRNDKNGVSENLKVLMSKAVSFANEEKYKEALPILQEILEQDNLCVEAYYLMAVLFTKIKQYDKSIEEFRRVLYIDPKLAVGYFHLGDVYRFLGKLNEAKKEYTNCLRVLKTTKEEETVPLSEGLTAGVLYQSAHRALETLEVIC